MSINEVALYLSNQFELVTGSSASSHPNTLAFLRWRTMAFFKEPLWNSLAVPCFPPSYNLQTVVRGVSIPFISVKPGLLLLLTHTLSLCWDVEQWWATPTTIDSTFCISLELLGCSIYPYFLQSINCCKRSINSLHQRETMPSASSHPYALAFLRWRTMAFFPGTSLELLGCSIYPYFLRSKLL